MKAGLILSLIIVLALSGCAVTKQRETITIQGLEPQATLRFSDIPTPEGFKILSQESFILESEGARAGMLKYSGEAEVEDLVSFYKDQMSTYNWDLLNVLEYGDRMLNFERGDEACVITLKQKGASVEILVSLSPESPVPVSGEGIASQEFP